MKKLLVIALLVAIATTGAAMSAHAFLGMFSSHKAVQVEDGLVKLPISDVSDGKPHYFKLQDNGKEIRFFVLKSSDGVLRAAFDACDVCYRSRKGYSQDGDFMVCNNCGMKFHSSRINVVKGGCNPAPLNRRVEGDNLVIAKKDILPGARFF